jgi:hypothetical protein
MKNSAAAKPSWGSRRQSSGSDYTTPLVTSFLLALALTAGWYLWPRPAPGPQDEQTRHKVRELTNQSPDAEVFDLGAAEKKK